MGIEYKNFDRNVLVSEAYTTAAEQASIAMPYTPNGFLVQLTPVGGTASVQVSLDGVDWETWVLGEISAMAIGSAKPVRLMRVVNTTATESALTVWGY